MVGTKLRTFSSGVNASRISSSRSRRKPPSCGVAVPPSAPSSAISTSRALLFDFFVAARRRGYF
jgi:hypothetical protein